MPSLPLAHHAALEKVTKGKIGNTGRKLILAAGIVRSAEMVAWYLGGTGVTGAKGGASMKRVEQDIGRLLWIMKWGKMGKLVLGLMGVLLLVVGAAMTEGGNGNKKNK